MASGGGYPTDINELQPQLVMLHGRPIYMRPTKPINLPETQEDLDRLGVVRNQRLGRLKWLGVALVVVSLLSLVLNAVTISKAVERYRGKLYAGVIPGIVGITVAVFSFGLVKEGQMTLTGGETTSCFRCMAGCQIFTTVFGTIGSLIAIVLSSVLLLTDCTAVEKTVDIDANNSCATNTDALFTLSVLNLIVFAVLLGLMFANICCGSCLNKRAFGIKTQYELLLEQQNVRTRQMQQQQQSAQNQVNVQPGYQPQQVGSFQPQYQNGNQLLDQSQAQVSYQTSPPPVNFQGQMCNPQSTRCDDPGLMPSASLIPNTDCQSSTNSEDPPPSYSEAMKQN